jgi:hypothetical protein
MAGVFSKVGETASEAVLLTPQERAKKRAREKIQKEAAEKIAKEGKEPELVPRKPTFAEAQDRINETRARRLAGLEPAPLPAFFTEESIAAVSDAEVIRQKEKVRSKNRPRSRQSSVFAGLTGQTGGSIGGVSRRVGSVFGDFLG